MDRDFTELLASSATDTIGTFGTVVFKFDDFEPSTWQVLATSDAGVDVIPVEGTVPSALTFRGPMSLLKELLTGTDQGLEAVEQGLISVQVPRELEPRVEVREGPTVRGFVFSF